jgi:hypothetical protein
VISPSPLEPPSLRQSLVFDLTDDLDVGQSWVQDVKDLLLGSADETCCDEVGFLKEGKVLEVIYVWW